MTPILPGLAADGLERSCAAADFIRLAPSGAGLERIEAYFTGHAYDPHRHDTYAIGLTLSGVQSFRFRARATTAWRATPSSFTRTRSMTAKPGRSRGFGTA